MSDENKKVLLVIGGLTVIGIALGLASVKFVPSFDTTKKYILEGTLLEGTVVAKVNGDIAIVSQKSSSLHNELDTHIHYFDIINGENMTNVSQSMCSCQ